MLAIHSNQSSAHVPQTDFYFNDLPEELQTYIFSFLNPKDQKPTVCRAWMKEFRLHNQIRRIAGIVQNPLDRTHPSYKRTAQLLAALWQKDRPAAEEMLRRLSHWIGRLQTSMEQAEATNTFLGEIATMPLENVLKEEILTRLYTSAACPPIVRLVFGNYSDPLCDYAPFQPFRNLDLSGLPGCATGHTKTFKAMRVPNDLARKLNVSKENHFEVNEQVVILDYDPDNIGKQKLFFGNVREVRQEGNCILYKCSVNYGRGAWIGEKILSSAYIARIPNANS